MLVKTIALIRKRDFIPGQPACQLALTSTSNRSVEKHSLRADPVKTIHLHGRLRNVHWKLSVRVRMLLKIPMYISFPLHSLCGHAQCPGNEAALRHKVFPSLGGGFAFLLSLIRQRDCGSDCFSIHKYSVISSHTLYLILRYMHLKYHNI